MIPFSVMFIIGLFFGLLSIASGFDFGGEGAGEGLDFGGEGAGEGLDLGGEGAGEGLDFGGEGSGDGLDAGDGADIHSPVSGSTEGLFKLVLKFLNVGHVPITVILFSIVTIMWGVAMFLHIGFGRVPFGMSAGVGAVVVMFLFSFVIAVVSAIFSTGFLTKPLKKVFQMRIQHGEAYLVGKVCIVRTLTVTAKSGQAEIIYEGSHLLLSVRCDSENALTKSSEAVIVSYNEEKNLYYIKPL